MAGRIPPQNLEAEQSILGGLMLDSQAWDQVGDILLAEDFYRPGHQSLFNAIKTLIHKNQPVDLITITNFLTAENILASVGGPEYLIDLVNKTVSTANIQTHAKIVKDKALLRKSIQVSSEVIDEAYTEDFASVDEFLSRSEGKFFQLSEVRQVDGLVGPMDVVRKSMMKIEELYNRKSDITGIATGFSHLDKMTSGLQNGELTILAARPSMGKTALSLNIAQHIALKEKKTVAYFSLEMSREAMMMRLLSSEARVNMRNIQSGKVADNAWPKLIEAAGHVSEAPIYIDESSGLGPYEIRSRCRRLKAQHGLDVIMIDYLQLMKMKEKTESREREVAEISRTLKSIAKELQVPVIALAQLNRGVEGRTEKRPMLSDLRESGSIEQDADVIMMLYREDYYDKDDPEKQGNAEIIIGKQRNGPTGVVKLKFEAEYSRFKDAEESMGAARFSAPSGPNQSNPGFKPKNFAPGP